MTTSQIPSYFNFNTAYKTVSDYVSPVYQRSVVWIKNTCSQTYAKLPDMKDVAKRHISYVFTAGKAFVWKNKLWFMGAAALAGAAWKIHNYWINRPQYPDVILQSTLNYAKLSMTVPKEKYVPPNITLTFCIDTSGSMDNEGRLVAVKTGLYKVLDNAQKVVNEVPEANISLAIVEFNEYAHEITKPIKLISNNLGPVNSVKEQIKGLEPNGGTDIIAGLKMGAEKVKQMSQLYVGASHRFIGMTDGDVLNLDPKEIESFHNILASVGAYLDMIGIGKQHVKKVMKEIAGIKEWSLSNFWNYLKFGSFRGTYFRGTYIDTTNGKDTIESAIFDIYKRAISSFHKLELTSPQLPPGTWSVIDTPSTIEKGQAKCNLGSVEEGKNLIKYIEIHGEKLTTPLDLSTVTFNLTFTDPKGRQGELSLPWNPNTTIDNQLVTERKKL